MTERISSTQGHTPFIRWALASRPMRGQATSGDCATVLVSGARTILAAIDGLGHGPEAAHASRRASEVIDHNPAEPLEVLLLLAHRELAETRGAAATVAIVDAESGTLQWLGVGNVEGVLVRADIEARPRSRGVFLVSGVLGYHVARMHVPEPLALAHGDLIVLATDGVRANLAEVARLDLTPDRLANSILTKHGQPDDDALVLAARYQAPHMPEVTGFADSGDEQSVFQPLNRPSDKLDDDSTYGPLGPSSNR
ncbi:MAG: SpoIIE family protein phosphatase [Acidimicrobiales bacterium]